MTTTSTNLCFSPSSPHAGAKENDHISGRFREAREHKGMTLADAADAINCARSLLGRIESGSARDTSDKGLITRAAAVYGVHPNWLFAGSCAPPRFCPRWAA